MWAAGSCALDPQLPISGGGGIHTGSGLGLQPVVRLMRGCEVVNRACSARSRRADIRARDGKPQMALTCEGRTIFIPRLQAWAVQKQRSSSVAKARPVSISEFRQDFRSIFGKRRAGSFRENEPVHSFRTQTWRTKLSNMEELACRHRSTVFRGARQMPPALQRQATGLTISGSRMRPQGGG